MAQRCAGKLEGYEKMNKAQKIAAGMNRALAGKSEFFPHAVQAEKYAGVAEFFALNIENVGIYWLGTATLRQPTQPTAQIFQLRKRDRYSRLIGGLRRDHNGVWHGYGFLPCMRCCS